MVDYDGSGSEGRFLGDHGRATSLRADWLVVATFVLDRGQVN